jgi:uncharacterized repeat protein (TIGR01451 family)
MKKYILLLFILSLQFIPAKAQYVSIPDADFVTWLTQEYPSCMSGNQMDTTCALIVNEDSVTLNTLNMTSIDGIQYFDNLLFLKCVNTPITSLPQLPSTLIKLWCNINQLTSLPGLPNSLMYLACDNNQISNLPSLPTTLKELSCGANLIDSLPQLPLLLEDLICNNNQLTHLPILPNSLSFLECSNNTITALPTLSSSLYYLGCKYNLLTDLPLLPNSLNSLYCDFNAITNLPPLPSSLSILICPFNQLNSIPTLPGGLTQLICAYNPIVTLPSFPNSLIILKCFNCQLTSLSAVPNTMFEFNIANNNIACLFNLPQVTSSGNISNNPLTCVPNQTNYSLGLPFCLENDTVNNPNNCPSANITGYVYTDLNNNCNYNNTDLHTENVPVKLYDSQNNFIALSHTVNGVYSFTSLVPDSFQLKINDSILPFAMACGQPNNQGVLLDSANQFISGINFPVVCDMGYDLYVQSVNAQGMVFPGQVHTLNTNITNNETWFNLDCGFSNHTGLVTIKVVGPVTYVSPAPGALTPQASGLTFLYNISNFNNLTPSSFGLLLKTDTTAQAGDQICVFVEILPTPLDADTTNNTYIYCYQIVNSYDPNMKEVYPVNVQPGYNDWFTYTIHFQNTGNAPAINIRLLDTLDTQLDLNSFEVLGFSNDATTTLNSNILTVKFNNIMLPDSTTDYNGSMGYFQYRIKPLPNMPLGAQIENTAYIYFDYNSPVITNTTQNNYVTGLFESLVSSPYEFILYPNPSNGVFNFKDTKNVKQVEVYNLLGEQIVAQGNQKQINLSAFARGIYYARINGEVVVKLVKE